MPPHIHEHVTAIGEHVGKHPKLGAMNGRYWLKNLKVTRVRDLPEREPMTAHVLSSNDAGHSPNRAELYFEKGAMSPNASAITHRIIDWDAKEGVITTQHPEDRELKIKWRLEK